MTQDSQAGSHKTTVLAWHVTAGHAWPALHICPSGHKQGYGLGSPALQTFRFAIVFGQAAVTFAIIVNTHMALICFHLALV